MQNQSLTYITLLAFTIATTLAFAPQPSIPTTSTVLNFNIVMPPDEDNWELDNSNCEESVFARKRREKQEENEKLHESYKRGGMTLRDIDVVETVDQYDNAAGGNLIPGINLSALCEDDWVLSVTRAHLASNFHNELEIY